MTQKPCYKEDSLSDFAEWAVQCGHYPVAPLIQNYREYLEDVRTRNQTSPTEDSRNTKPIT